MPPMQSGTCSALHTSPLWGGRRAKRGGWGLDSRRLCTPPLSPPHRKSGLPDLRIMVRNPGRPRFRGEENAAPPSCHLAIAECAGARCSIDLIHLSNSNASPFRQVDGPLHVPASRHFAPLKTRGRSAERRTVLAIAPL